MSSITTHSPVDALAFEQIEAAVKETSRGRWFLDEYARRHRQADTVTILAAIEQLQQAMRSQGPAPAAAAAAPAAPAAAMGETPPLSADILDMARAIARAQAEIRALRGTAEPALPHGSASDELDSVITTTERATSTILSAAEHVQEKAWILREEGYEPETCDLFDSKATEIYTACSFQDLTAQRIRKMVDAIRFVDQRLHAMIGNAGLAAAFEAEIAHFAVEARSATSDDIWMSEGHQAEIDETFDFFTPAAGTLEPTIVGDAFIETEDDTFDLPVARASAPEAREKTFRMEKVGFGEPDHDALLDGIIDQPAPAAPAPAATSFADLDSLPTEARLRAFR